jgi:peptide/nickel transport system substrate-binding protein
MKRRLFYSLAAATVVIMGAAACSSASSSSAGASGKGAAAATGKPLTIVSTELSPMTQNFNPFAQTGTGFQTHAVDLYQMPLMVFNTQNPAAAPTPELATADSWSPDGKTLTITTRSGVKWSDGKPFTAADVAFTFNLIKKFPALNAPATPIPVSATGSGNTAVLTFAQPELANLFFILETQIVPQHIWASIANPVTYTDPSPVGTGPYVLDQFSPQGFTMKINPNYYAASSLHVPEVDFPAYTSNANLLLPLANGTIDWGGISITGVQANYLSKSTSNATWTGSAPYFTDNNVVGLWFNTTKAPLNDPKVRQAISYGINRTQLSVDGESGNEPAVSSTAGLILPSQQSYQPASLANNLPAAGSSTLVSSTLTSDGYAKVGGFWEKNGQKITLSIEDPVTYSDYYQDSQLIVKQLTALGFDATVKGDAGPNGPTVWTTDLATGNFSAAIHWGNQGLTPYATYSNWMDYTQSAPVGKSATADYGRFNDPQAQAALKAYAAASTPATLNAAVTSLANIEATQVPVAPLLLGASWAEYSTRNYTGWPSATNSYQDPGPNMPEILYTIQQLKPVS